MEIGTEYCGFSKIEDFSIVTTLLCNSVSVSSWIFCTFESLFWLQNPNVETAALSSFPLANLSS